MAKATLIFAGTDDGVLLLTNPGGVGRWLRAGHELRGHALRALWVDAENPLLALALSSDTLFRSEDGGQSWVAAQPVGADALLAGGRTVALLRADGVLRSSLDGGRQWSDGAPADDVRGLAVSADARRIYAAGESVRVSDDGGLTWAPYGVGAPASARPAIVPGEPEALVAVADGAVWRCTAGTARWERLAGAPPVGGTPVVLAGREPTLLVAGEGGLVRGSGEVWERAESETALEQGVTALSAASYHMDTALAGTGGGQLLISADRGRSWQLLRRAETAVRCLAAARLA